MSSATSQEGHGWQRLALSTNGLLVVLLMAATAVFALLIGERFLSAATLRSMAFQLPELGILSLAMMVTLLKGGLNLSIIATANLTALTIAYVLQATMPGAEGFAWIAWQVVAIACGLLVALAIGLVNGTVIAYLGVSPILATLGTMTLVEGLSIGLTRGGVISGFPDTIVYIGNGTLLGVPFGIFVFLACAIPLAVWLRHTPSGNAIYLIGSNERAARFSGIDTRAVMLKVYVLSALLAAVAGIVMMARFNSANASYGESYLLVTILACVLGGVDPFGGFGRVAGLVLALVLLQVISSAFNLLGLSQFLTLAIWGGILIGATALMLRLGRR
ncbi:MAG: ABC transporter permease [Pseudomonadota bacterium]